MSLKRELVCRSQRCGGKGIPDLAEILLLRFTIIHARLCLENIRLSCL